MRPLVKPLVPKPQKFQPPRPARDGHAWARIGGSGLVNVIGFTADGAKKVRDWTQGELCEAPIKVIRQSPEVLIALT